MSQLQRVGVRCQGALFKCMTLTQKPWLLQGERDAKYKHRLWLRFQLSTRKRKETEFIIEGYNPKGVGTKHGTFQPLLGSTCPALLTPLVTAKLAPSLTLLKLPLPPHLCTCRYLCSKDPPSSLLSLSLFVLEKWINGLGDFRLLSYFTLYFLCHSAHCIHITCLIAHLPHSTTDFSKAGTVSILLTTIAPAFSSISGSW